MVTTTFLTAYDDRVAVEGSVDPLGLTPIWVGFSRRFISNLTTVTTSTHDIATVLIACALGAHEAIGRGLLTVAPFLRFEQLAAFTREEYRIGQTVRGVRVVKQLLQTQVRVDHNVGILSNQRAYGVWGYYTGPMAQSGLLTYIKEGYVLSDDAREVTLDLLKAIKPFERERLREAMLADRDLDNSTTRSLMKIVRRLFNAFEKHRGMRSLIRETFARGGFATAPEAVSRKQRLLYQLVPTFEDSITEGLIHRLATSARRHDGGQDLAEDLLNMMALDHVLTQAKTLFDYLRHRTFSQEALAKDLASSPWAAARSSSESQRALTAIRQAVPFDNKGSTVGQWAAYLDATDKVTQVRELLAIHGRVMQARGSAPWIERSGSGELRPVRANGQIREFPPDGEEVLNFGYFLPSLISLKGEL